MYDYNLFQWFLLPTLFLECYKAKIANRADFMFMKEILAKYLILPLCIDKVQIIDKGVLTHSLLHSDG